MFEIIWFVAPRVLLVLLGFMVYRKLSTWKGFHEKAIWRGGSKNKVALSGQKGFVRIYSPSENRTASVNKTVKKRANKDIRAPWGW